MGKYSIDEATLKEVADSIRAKTETTDEIPVTEFASRIGDITTGVELETHPSYSQAADASSVLLNRHFWDESGAVHVGTMENWRSQYYEIQPEEVVDMGGGYYESIRIRGVGRSIDVTCSNWDGSGEYVTVYYGHATYGGWNDYPIYSGEERTLPYIPANGIIVVKTTSGVDTISVENGTIVTTIKDGTNDWYIVTTGTEDMYIWVIPV